MFKREKEMERERKFVCREGEREGRREKQRWRDTEREYLYACV
jgi:hypothetical protein